MSARDRRFLLRTPLEWFVNFKLQKSDASEITKIIIEMDGHPFLLKRSIYVDDNKNSSELSLYSRYSDTHDINATFITEQDYYKLILNRMKKSYDIMIRHHTFYYDGATFAVDIYRSNLQGLATITTPCGNENKRMFPPFLDVGREITGDHTYSNYALAIRINANSLLDWKDNAILHL